MELAEHEICAVCDKPGAKQCAKCHRINYCSAECQVQDWRNVHAYECTAYASDEWRYTEAGVTSDAGAAADCPSLLALPRGVTVDGPFDPPPVASYRSHVHAVTWDLDETNTYTEAEWRSTENAVGQAWRTYLSGLAQTDSLPEILLVSLQAVQERNGLYTATLAMLEEVSGADWRGLRVYDSSILSRLHLGGLYQSQQLVFWRPAATVVNIWKTGTTCFRVGLRPNLNCEYGAAGVYLTYHPNDKALAAVPPIPLVAVSVHMDPATRKGRISSYQQVLRRLVPKLIRARKLQDHIRPPLDCVTVLMAGDMGWRRSSASAGAGTSADPLTLARFPAAGAGAGAGAADTRIFPFPEWAEVGQPYGGQMPITRDFVPPYRATCPMHTAKTFRPQFHQTVLQARQAGTADAYTGEYPATHCDRVFIKFPKNVYSLSAREWAANLLVPQSVNGHHEALAVHLPIEFDFRGACTNSPIAALIAETVANVQTLAEYTPEEWHDELAIARALDVHHAERAGAEDALVGSGAPLLRSVTSAEVHGATGEAVAAAAGATVAVASEVQEEPTCLTDDALQAALSAAELRNHLRAIAALYVRAAGTNNLREILHEDQLVASLAAPAAVALHEARTSVTRLGCHLDQAITPTHEGEAELDEW